MRALHAQWFRTFIKFSNLHRTFELSLVSKPELFSKEFQAVTVDENGTETAFMVNKNDFYHGFVRGKSETDYSDLCYDPGDPASD